MNEKKLFIKPEAVEHFRTLYQIMTHASDKYPANIAYRQPEGKDGEQTVTFAGFANMVEALRASLLHRGWAGKHIALFGEASIEWIAVYVAVVSGVGVCVPIDKELPPETIVKQLNFSDAELVFCSARGLRKMQKALPECPAVNDAVIMRKDELLPIAGAERVCTLKTLIDEGRALLAQKGSGALPERIDPDALAVIIFTSGTTGANKGVMLSNRNIMGTLRGCARLLHFPSTSISVLPVNHSYELHAHLMSCMYCGTSVSLNDDLKHLLKNLERFAPEMSCMVPVMLDLLVRRMKKQIEEQGLEKTFRRTVKLSNALLKAHVDVRRRLFKKLLAPLGGNLRMIICGGAALNQETIDFMKNIGIQVYNGYGITECSPVAAVNPSAKARRFSVGHVLPTMDVRIADPDENGNGEIQMRGDNVMLGYYKMPEDTAKVFTKDGWFRTGDIGRIDKDNFLYISGRLKNLIILPNGKNICPEEIEEALMKQIPYIKECVVFADEENTGLYAVCYLDPDFREANGLASAEEAKAYMQEDFNAYNAAMPGFKRLNDYIITDAEFEKSTTHKIQRFKIDAIKNKKKTAAPV